MHDRFSLKDIAAFVRVAELGSFKDAAFDLHLTPSALTQRLQKLEDAFGARLVERTTRFAALTAVGTAFLPSARRLLDQFDRSISDLEDVIAARGGHVTIASLISAATYVLPGALARFSAAHPEVRVRLLDDAEREIADYVRRGEAEFAIDMFASKPTEDPDLEHVAIARDPFVLACRPDHVAAGGGPIELEALADLPTVALGPRSGTSRLLSEHTPGRAATLNWRYEVQHLTTMIGFIEAGIGVGVIPRMALRALAGRELTYRPLATEELTRTIVMTTRRGASLSPSALRLKTFVLEEFRDGHTGAAIGQGRA